jgi:enoyl-CoA hydratase/carnithine racemase
MHPQFRSNERVSIEIQDNGVAHVRLIRADKLNALDEAMFAALLEAGQALFETRGLRAAVLAGEGRGFCAGIDLSLFNSFVAAGAPKLADRTHGNANAYQQAALQWRKLPVPVIAAIHGVCFGGGLQLASGADIRIVAPDARLSVMEMKWGLVPDMAGFALWREVVRDDLLRELLYTAREFSGEEAREYGFATYVDGDPLRRATEIAQAIADKSPHAVRAAKELANRANDAGIDDLLMAESRAQDKLMGSRNQQEAVESQIERRPPRFVDP